MKIAIFQAPRKILYGPGALEQAGAEASAFGKRAFVVTGKNSARKSGLLDKLLSILKAAGIQATVFNGINPDPTVEEVARGVEAARKSGSQVIVALGGGSALDAAKAVSIMLTNPGPITDYEHKAPSRPGVPVLAVPTTAGTGSEVSRYTVITDKVRQVKMLLGSPHLIPQLAILDPLLTVGMPPGVTAATGMDALTHAIEAYISTAAQPATDLQALSAIRLISGSLVKAVVNGENLEARGNMLLGQMQAGLAFSNSSVALVHALSRPLGARLGVPHGLANAILLPTVMEFNRPSCPERLADVAAAMGEKVEGLSVREASTRAVQAIAELFRKTGLPGTLGEAGVTEDIIPQLARDAMQSGSVLFNPRRPNEEEIAALYRLAL
jgi:1,3-propanediol dehydrogenase/alcohol dehydrogenase